MAKQDLTPDFKQIARLQTPKVHSDPCFDGEGSLTDQRNGDPTVRHPYRVMCRYESNLASYHVFLTYADGRYVFDPGDMSGTGVPTPRFVHGKPVTSAE